MSFQRIIAAVVGGWCLATAAGCGGVAQPDINKQIAAQNSEKVEIAKKIADAVEKGNQQDVSSALEEFRSVPLSAADHPKEAAEIADIYKTRIQPKVKGEASVLLEGEMKAYLGKK